MINLLLFMPSLVLYKMTLARNGVRLRVADVYFLTFMLTFMFFDGSYGGEGNYYHVLYVAAWPLLFLVGCLIGNALKFKIRPVVRPGWTHLVIQILGLYFIFVFIGNIGNITELDLSNYDEIRQNTEVTYFGYMFSKSLVFFVFLAAFASIQSNVIRALLFVMMFVVASATLQKALMLYSLMSIVIYKIIRGGKPLNVGVLLKILISVLIFTTSVSWIIYGSDLIVTFYAILRRIFLLPADLSYTTLKMASENNYLFMGGASLKTLFDFIGLPSIYLGEATYIYYFGHIVQSASANSPMLTAIFADFSYAGLIFAFIFGIFFKVIDNYFSANVDRSPRLLAAAYAALIICTLKFNITNFGTAFVSEGFLAVLVLFFIISVTKNGEKDVLWLKRLSFRLA